MSVRFEMSRFGQLKSPSVEGPGIHDPRCHGQGVWRWRHMTRRSAPWMLEQIETFGFVEHQDFEKCFPKTGSAKARPLVLITKTLCISRQMPKNGRPFEQCEFLDMVKELALFEGYSGPRFQDSDLSCLLEQGTGKHERDEEAQSPHGRVQGKGRTGGSARA